MRYVKACECHEWHLEVWPPDDPGSRRRVPYRCRSWRHAGGCRRWKGAQDYARCKEGIERRNNWTYIVLTFDQTAWDDPIDQYRHGFRLWSKLRLRLRRKYGAIAYIQTWERHKKGGAHVNVLVSNRKIFEAVSDDREGWEKTVLKPMARDCGFGWKVWAEPMRKGTGEGMAGYLTKLARELTGADGKDQIPIDAPPHFRRLRASAGVLPPPYKSGMTGRMRFMPIDEHTKAWEDAEAKRDDRAKRQPQEEEWGNPATNRKGRPKLCPGDVRSILQKCQKAKRRKRSPKTAAKV